MAQLLPGARTVDLLLSSFVVTFLSLCQQTMKGNATVHSYKQHRYVVLHRQSGK